MPDDPARVTAGDRVDPVDPTIGPNCRLGGVTVPVDVAAWLVIGCGDGA